MNAAVLGVQSSNLLAAVRLPSNFFFAVVLLSVTEGRR